MSSRITKASVLSLTKRHREKLRSLKTGIIYLFGSCAQSIATPMSDVDIGVVMLDVADVRKNTMPLYSELFEIFSGMVKNSNKLDIVFLQRAPLELRFDVIRHGRVLYEASLDFRLDFEEGVTVAYCDFYPILRDFDEAIIKRAA